MPTVSRKLIVTPPEIPGVSPGDLSARLTEPAPGWQRRLTVGTAIAGFAAFLQVYATQPLLPSLRHIFTASELQVSLTVSAVTAAVALASPVIGLLADLIGRKRIIVPAILAMSAPMILASTATTLNGLIFWRFLQGLCVPGIIAVTVAYIAEESPPGAAATITAAYVTGTVAGGLCGRLLSALVADFYGWRTAFVFLGGMTFLCGLLTWVWLPRSQRFRRTEDLASVLLAMRGHLHNPRLIATYLVGFNVLFSLVGVFTYANFLLAAPPFKLSTTALGFVFLVYALGLFVTPASGPFIERVGHRRALVSAIGVVSLGAALTLIPVLGVVVLGLALLASGVFVCQASASSHAVTAAREARSAAMGLYVLFYYLGGSVGTVVLGWAWKLGHWPACVMTVLAVQLVTAGVAYRYFTQPKSQPA